MSQVGVQESSNWSTVSGYWATAGVYGGVNSSTGWCATFAYAMYAQAGIQGAGTSVNSWRQWGAESSMPQVGDIAIFRNEASHVGIVVAVSGNQVTLVHGNWSNQVSQTTDVSTNYVFKRP